MPPGSLPAICPRCGSEAEALDYNRYRCPACQTMFGLFDYQIPKPTMLPTPAKR